MSDHHREGDGSTPAGAYGIGPIMYGLAPDPGVRYRYHRLVCGDWWDEDPSSPTYNTFQHVACNASPPFHGKSEALWKATTAYQRFAVIGYNASPVAPGAGSAVFLHDDTGKPTAGCVSLPAPELDRLLRWLDPRRSPLIVIGTDPLFRPRSGGQGPDRPTGSAPASRQVRRESADLLGALTALWGQ